MLHKKIMALTALAAAAAISLSACSSSSKSSSASGPQLVANVSSLSGGVSTAVALDGGFTDALKTLGLTPGTVGKATLSGGSVSFPITGGNVKYYKPGSVMPYVVGDIQHQGSGLSLSAGSTKVELTNFDIDPGASNLYGDVAVNGTTAASHTKLFDLDGSTLKPLETQGNNAILTGTRVLLGTDAAALLDKTFKTTAVKGGLLIGIATITIATK